MNRTATLLYVRLASFGLLLFLPVLAFAQDADFPAPEVSPDTRAWFDAPIVWIAAGVLFLVLFWIARRRRTRVD